PAPNRPNLANNPRNSTRSVSGYFTRPTSGYLSQGLHPTNAVDIAGACWSPVYAGASGNVALATGGGGWNGGYGNYVAIDHPNGTRTLYAHMIQVKTSAGAYVNQGAVIGYMGSTGRSTGCHLHFEVRGAANPIR
ncbi:MAG: M23 family metallopeptidase, partial [Candidatus Spechtbacterales bacterium]